MKRTSMCMVPALLLVGLSAGCENGQKSEEPVTRAPEPLLEPFPEEQTPDPEPQPETRTPVARADQREALVPVDSTATGSPSVAPRPQPKESYAPPARQAQRTHVVRKGETLQKISQQYYGTTTRWRRLFEANRDQLADPNLIQVGMRLRIP